jgi:DNA-binding NarL/FixJ family response regulator
MHAPGIEGQFSLAGTAHGRNDDPAERTAKQSIFPNGGAMGVMVVDDSDTVRAVWHDMINRIAGLSIAGEFSRAAAAAAGIRRNPPDIVLLDIQLDGESGMEVLKLAVDNYPCTKVLVVTNYADAIYRRHYMNAGAFAFFDKSHELKKLRHTLECLAALGMNAYLTGNEHAAQECQCKFPHAHPASRKCAQ